MVRCQMPDKREVSGYCCSAAHCCFIKGRLAAWPPAAHLYRRSRDSFVRGRSGVQGAAVEITFVRGGAAAAVGGEGGLVEAVCAPRALHRVRVHR